MKPSHFQTPRQMRDCMWTSGSVTGASHQSMSWGLADIAAAIVCVAAAAVIGCVLAWGV